MQYHQYTLNMKNNYLITITNLLYTRFQYKKDECILCTYFIYLLFKFCLSFSICFIYFITTLGIFVLVCRLTGIRSKEEVLEWIGTKRTKLQIDRVSTTYLQRCFWAVQITRLQKIFRRCKARLLFPEHSRSYGNMGLLLGRALCCLT